MATLSFINTITGALEDTAYSPGTGGAWFNKIKQVANESTSTQSFKIEALGTGKLEVFDGTTWTEVDAADVATGVYINNTGVQIGATLYTNMRYTAAQDASGQFTMFSVRASDAPTSPSALSSAVAVKVLVAAVNDKPVLEDNGFGVGSDQTLALTGIEDNSITITYDQLAAAAQATDVDSPTIQFQVTSLPTCRVSTGYKLF